MKNKSVSLAKWKIMLLALGLSSLMLPGMVQATLCPDMSETSVIPSGWVLFPDWQQPGMQNPFVKAIYSYNPNFFPEGHVICGYANKTIIGSFSLLSKNAYPQPTGINWVNNKNSGILTCSQVSRAECIF